MLQHFRDQLFEARIAREAARCRIRMRPDSLGLIGIDDDEGNLGLTGPDNNIASTADDDEASSLHRFSATSATYSKSIFRKKAISRSESPSSAKEASPQRLCAGSPDRRAHRGPVIGTERTDFNRTTVAKMLDRRIAAQTMT